MEGADLVFPIHHQTGGNRLNASGGEAPAHFLPKQGRKLVAHNAVKDPPCLLGIHQIMVDGPGLLNGLGHHPAGNFIERNAVDLVVGNVQQCLQMPGDGLSLSIRVGCEIYLIALFGEGFQIANNVLFALYGLVDRREIMLKIHAHGALGQIPQMPHAGLHLIVTAEIFSDCLCLGG